MSGTTTTGGTETGGTLATSPTGGASSGDTTRATGSTHAASVGGSTMTGGTNAASGGTGAATGGANTANGGVSATSGGATHATGGTRTSLSAGGSSSAVGGSLSSGGSAGAGGSFAGGGASTATGGIPGTGGAATGGTSAVDPNASAAINTCIDQLPYGGRDLSADERAPIVTAIINTCVEFAPPGEDWQSWCQMFLVAAINAESSFNPLAGTVGAGNDPSVGLLQIRFSSVVIDFANYGPVDALERIGCDFGTVTSSDSYATKGDMMKDVACNVGIGAWYYFIFASGNGGSSVVWVDQYCSGRGVAGNLHIGMASFLMGGEAAHTSLSGADFYYNEIKDWSAPCITYTGTHPFELPIEPDRGKYCG